MDDQLALNPEPEQEALAEMSVPIEPDPQSSHSAGVSADTTTETVENLGKSNANSKRRRSGPIRGVSCNDEDDNYPVEMSRDDETKVEQPAVSSRPRRNSAVAASIKMAADSPRRTTRATELKKERKMALEMDVGERPDLVSILRRRSENSGVSDSQRAAKRIMKKYRFSEKMSIRVIAPIDGFVHNVMRFGADEGITEYRQHNNVSINNRLRLTPVSDRKVMENLDNDDEDGANCDMNAVLLFAGEEDADTTSAALPTTSSEQPLSESSEQNPPKKVVKRRKSYVRKPISASILAQPVVISPEPTDETNSNVGDDAISQVVSSSVESMINAVVSPIAGDEKKRGRPKKSITSDIKSNSLESYFVYSQKASSSTRDSDEVGQAGGTVESKAPKKSGGRRSTVFSLPKPGDEKMNASDLTNEKAVEATSMRNPRPRGRRSSMFVRREPDVQEPSSLSDPAKMAPTVSASAAKPRGRRSTIFVRQEDGCKETNARNKRRSNFVARTVESGGEIASTSTVEIAQQSTSNETVKRTTKQSRLSTFFSKTTSVGGETVPEKSSTESTTFEPNSETKEMGDECTTEISDANQQELSSEEPMELCGPTDESTGEFVPAAQNSFETDGNSEKAEPSDKNAASGDGVGSSATTSEIRDEVVTLMEFLLESVANAEDIEPDQISAESSAPTTFDSVSSEESTESDCENVRPDEMSPNEERDFKMKLFMDRLSPVNELLEEDFVMPKCIENIALPPMLHKDVQVERELTNQPVEVNQVEALRSDRPTRSRRSAFLPTKMKEAGSAGTLNSFFKPLSDSGKPNVKSNETKVASKRKSTAKPRTVSSSSDDVVLEFDGKREKEVEKKKDKTKREKDKKAVASTSMPSSSAEGRVLRTREKKEVIVKEVPKVESKRVRGSTKRKSTFFTQSSSQNSSNDGDDDDEISIVSDSSSMKSGQFVVPSSIQLANSDPYKNKPNAKKRRRDREEKRSSLERTSRKSVERFCPYMNEFDHAPFSSHHVFGDVEVQPGVSEELVSIEKRNAEEHCCELFKHANANNVISRILETETISTEKPLTEENVRLTRMDAEELEMTILSLGKREKTWFRRVKSKVAEEVAASCSQSWSMLLKPTTSDEWLGCSEAATTLRKFLKKWKKRVAREEVLATTSGKPAKKSKRGGRDDSDDDYECDDDEEDQEPNPMILCGPSGSGKSSLIEALACELNMSVLEVHPGDRRNGAALRSRLAGAVASHRVNLTGISSFFAKKDTPPTQPVEKKQTVVVVEHVDVSFSEEDKDFFAALKSLATEAKVPIIWTCEQMPLIEMAREPRLECPVVYLDRFPDGLVVDYARISTWALCSVDVSRLHMEQIAKRANFDLRSLLLELEWMLAHDMSSGTATLSRELPKSSGFDVDWNMQPRAVYSDRQEEVAAKKLRYRSIYEETENMGLQLLSSSLPYSSSFDSLMACHERLGINNEKESLLTAQTSLNNAALRNEIAMDFMPCLVAIDENFRNKASRVEKRRRPVHYFRESRQPNWRTIDSDGELVKVVGRFKFPAPQRSEDGTVAVELSENVAPREDDEELDTQFDEEPMDEDLPSSRESFM